MAVVYALVADDFPAEVRYIGQTKHGIDRRLRRHIEAAHGGSLYPVHRWIRAVEDRGAFVEVIVLAREATWNIDEIEQIAHFRRLGAPLLNCTAGGDGHLDPSPETRAKLSASRRGVAKTVLHRQRISAAHRRRLTDPVAREALRLRHVGAKRSDATRARLSGENNASAVMTADMVLAIRTDARNGDDVRTIADRYSIKYATCYAAVKELTWRSVL